MPTLECPGCGEEYEVEVSFAPPDREVGIPSYYIDDFSGPDCCDSCGHGLEEYTENMEKEKGDEWVEAYVDGLFYRD